MLAVLLPTPSGEDCDLDAAPKAARPPMRALETPGWRPAPPLGPPDALKNEGEDWARHQMLLVGLERQPA